VAGVCFDRRDHGRASPSLACRGGHCLTPTPIGNTWSSHQFTSHGDHLGQAAGATFTSALPTADSDTGPTECIKTIDTNGEGAGHRLAKANFPRSNPLPARTFWMAAWLRHRVLFPRWPASR
jgi:hypothetical protein